MKFDDDDDDDHKLLNFKRVLDTFFFVAPLSNTPHHFKSQHKVTSLIVDIVLKTIASERCNLILTPLASPVGNYWRRSGVFIVNFEHISHLVLVFLFLTLSR